MQLTVNKACLGILGLTVCVVGKTYMTHTQYYPTMISLAKSSPCTALIYIQGAILVYWIGKVFKSIFFGTLQRNEIENIIEQMWGAVTDTVLAFTIFRDITSYYVSLFVLLFLKFFHWTMQDRVESMERNLFISWKFHLRIISLILIFSFFDSSFLFYAYDSLATNGYSAQIIFGFEYLILILSVITMTLKYIFHTIDLTSQQPWDNKTTFIMYTELTSSFIRLCLYLVLVAIMTQYIFVPLFALWPTYIAFRSFRYYFTVILLARKAVSNLRSYQVPSTEELERYNDLCIVCREDLVNRDCRKLPCGHIYHLSCLKSWFQRKQSCPLCRFDVLSDPQPRTHNSQPDVGAAVPPANNQTQRKENSSREESTLGKDPRDDEPKSKPQPITDDVNQFLAKDAVNLVPDINSPQSNSTIPQSPSFLPNQFPVPIKDLTLEELTRLEGEGRAAIEARLLLLQNVRQLLDCATVQLSSYLDSTNK